MATSVGVVQAGKIGGGGRSDWRFLGQETLGKRCPWTWEKGQLMRDGDSTLPTGDS